MSRLQNEQLRVQIRLAADLILRPVIQVIKEDAAEAAPLIAVLAEEILVCPRLEPRIVCGIMIVTHPLHHSTGCVSAPHNHILRLIS